MAVDFTDDRLETFDAQGAPALDGKSRTIQHDGATIWFTELGHGPAVILLHGGLGNSGNWGYQVPVLAAANRVIAIDSRGHGRSTADQQPYRYDRMAADVLAIMDDLGIDRAALVGWSDGACIAMELARAHPERVRGVLYFGCNMDPSGAKPFEMSTALEHCFSRHGKDYAELSTTPDQFQPFVDAVGLMQRTQPNWSAADLAAVAVPVTIIQAEFDEFIKPEHARYLAATIPGAKLVELPGVSHFAPLQRPGVFNAAVLDFLGSLPG